MSALLLCFGNVGSRVVFWTPMLVLAQKASDHWWLGSCIRHANIAVEFYKQTVSEPVKYVTPVFFPWTIFYRAILCEIKLLQSLFDQQYINVGQIYNIQPQGLVETLMILMFLSLCVYLVSWYQGRLTGTKVCPEWQVKNISFPPSSGTVIFSCSKKNTHNM